MSSNILEQFTIVSAIYGGYQLEHKNSKDRVIYKNIISHIYYEDQKLLMEKRNSIENCPYLQRIINYSISQYKSEQQEQPLNIALRFDSEINNRMKQKIYWTEEELLNTIESAVQSLCVLHENQLVHGDIRPCSIACDMSGEVKLLDQFATSNYFFKVKCLKYYLSFLMHISIEQELIVKQTIRKNFKFYFWQLNQVLKKLQKETKYFQLKNISRKSTKQNQRNHLIKQKLFITKHFFLTQITLLQFYYS